MRTQITAESVENASSQFWEQMLGMSLTRVHKGTVSDSALDRRHVLGSCELTGVWNGRIEVRISMGLALHATAAMLMQSPGQVQPEDMLDAAREIANMAGTSRETVTRLLNQFRREKLISIKGASMTILKPEALDLLTA